METINSAAHPGVNALRLLVRQQAMIQQLLQRYRAARSAQALTEADATYLTRTFCLAISVHLHLQEEMLYPAARELLHDEGLLSGLADEQQSVQCLLAELDEAPPNDLLSGVRLAVLSDRLDHLFARQQCRLFPRLDAVGLGRLLLRRQQELLLDLDLDRLPARSLH